MIANQNSDDDSQEKQPYKKLKTEIVVNPEIFADPKYDITFKKLFADEKHKDILISLLNSLLDFQGLQEIVDVEINNNELEVVEFSEKQGQSGISGSVDVLCTNKGKQKIAIEMQRQRTKYFLAREQEYMAKLISGQVKEGEGKQYHQKVLATYIVVICKESVFYGQYALSDPTLFEIDVQPMVLQTNQVFPGNKMFWKFFELDKFCKSAKYAKINKDSPLKEQWLEFLIDCSNQDQVPDRDYIITRGYEIMKIAKWTTDQQVLYWKQKANESDMRQEREDLKKEEYTRGRAEGVAEGEAKGKLKGEIKGEISKIKDFLAEGFSKERIIPKLKLLKQGTLEEKLDDNLKYIKEHDDDSDSVICEALGLVEALLPSGSELEA